MTAAHWTVLLMAAVGLASPVRTPLQAGTKPSPIATAEALYADWLDALSALATVASGFTRGVAGRGHKVWAARLREWSAKLDVALAGIDAESLAPEDARALKAIRKGLTDNEPDVPFADPAHPALRCSDGARRDGDAATLQVALYECFEEIGNRIDFEGRPIVRTTALQQLQQLADRDQRKRLFLAFGPLWLTINGANTADSPYRRMMALNGAATQSTGRSPISDAAQTLGITPLEAEQWLVRGLGAGHARSRGPALEPWDYWYASAR